jgi:hypothetical protein
MQTTSYRVGWCIPRALLVGVYCFDYGPYGNVKIVKYMVAKQNRRVI